MTVAAATPADVTELAAVATATFPLACPPSVTAENVAAFLSDNLSADNFKLSNKTQIHFFSVR